MENGFITLHRKIMDHPLFQNSKLFKLFLTLLFEANFEDKRFLSKKYGEITIKRGQLITGRFKLAQLSHLKPSTVRDALVTLQKLAVIDIKPTNKYSVITIKNYSNYQDRRKNPRKSDTKTDIQNDIQSDIQNDNKMTQTNNDNNVNNDNNYPPEADEVNQLFKIFYETINPNINYSHKGNRESAKWLIDKYGLEKTSNAAKYAISVQGKPYSPVITTPAQLKNKMSELIIFQKKNIINKESKTLIL